MSYELRFEIPGLPRMANLVSGKSHWRHAHQEAKKWQSLVALTVGSRKPKSPLVRYLLQLVRGSSTEPDYDGLVRGFKSVVDGLKYSGVIADDKLSNSGVWQCSWEKTPRNKGNIRVFVQERL